MNLFPSEVLLWYVRTFTVMLKNHCVFWPILMVQLFFRPVGIFMMMEFANRNVHPCKSTIRSNTSGKRIRMENTLTVTLVSGIVPNIYLKVIYNPENNPDNGKYAYGNTCIRDIVF